MRYYQPMAISARYQPCLGCVGEVAERALTGRVADATVDEFLDQVALRVESIIAGDESRDASRPAQNGTTGPMRSAQPPPS